MQAYKLYSRWLPQSQKSKSHLKNLVMYPEKIRTPSELLLEVMKEETILFTLDNGETPKEKERAVYKNVQVKLENKGKIDLFQKCTNETDLLTSADHIDPSCRCPLFMRRHSRYFSSAMFE